MNSPGHTHTRVNTHVHAHTQNAQTIWHLRCGPNYTFPWATFFNTHSHRQLSVTGCVTNTVSTSHYWSRIFTQCKGKKSLNAKRKRSECGENLSIQSISKDLWGGRGGLGVEGGERALNPCTSDQMDKSLQTGVTLGLAVELSKQHATKLLQTTSKSRQNKSSIAYCTNHLSCW